jgi:uncharacterized protein (DUF305 family)
MSSATTPWRRLALPVLVLGCDYRATERTPDADAPALNVDGEAPPAADQVFLDRMIRHHRGSIDMARVAAHRAEHPKLEALAEEAMAEQRAELDQMEAWRNSWYGDPTVPPVRAHDEKRAMANARADRKMAEQVHALEQSQPFDLAFIDAMIPHQRTAVEMSQNAVRHAERTEVRSLAAMISRDRTKEIAAMEEWRATWYPDVQAANVHP